MTERRPYLILATAALAAAVWYLFRPELLFVDRRINEAPPAVAGTAAPSTVASGRFVTDAHETGGTASVLRAPDGRAFLRLSGFWTSNGPDVRVYLVAADSVAGPPTVQRAQVIDLGALKGNVGDQNYELPEGTDFTRYRAVSIWCRRFSVNFGAASLH